MTIELKPEQERVIGQAIQAGLIETADEVVTAGVEAIRRRLESRQKDANVPFLLAEDWEREFDAWLASFPDTPPLSDEAIGRESLYPDRL